MAKPTRKEHPSQNYLIECFDYNMVSGKCFWKERPQSHFSSEKQARRMNKRYAGKEVGTFIKSGSPMGYRFVKLFGKCWYLHRLIYIYMKGEVPLNVDHINLDKSDNSWINLRHATLSQNCCNIKPRASSGYLGVHKTTKGDWRVQRKKDGIVYQGGTHSSIIDAAKASDKLAIALHGSYAKLNFKGL